MTLTEVSATNFVIVALAALTIPATQQILGPALENIPPLDLSPPAIFKTASLPRTQVKPRDLVLPRRRTKACTAIIGESVERVVAAKASLFPTAEIFNWSEDLDYLLDQSNSQQYPGYGSVLESANFLWIQNIMARRCHIHDIGFDEDRSDFGFFYLAELEWTRGYTNKSFVFFPGSGGLR